MKILTGIKRKKLRSMPAPFILADECDAFTGDTQGRRSYRVIEAPVHELSAG